MIASSENSTPNTPNKSILETKRGKQLLASFLLYQKNKGETTMRKTKIAITYEKGGVETILMIKINRLLFLAKSNQS